MATKNESSEKGDEKKSDGSQAGVGGAIKIAGSGVGKVFGVGLLRKTAAREAAHVAKPLKLAAGTIDRLRNPSREHEGSEAIGQILTEAGLDTSVDGIVPEVRRRWAMKARFWAVFHLGLAPLSLAAVVGSLVSADGVRSLYWLIFGLFVGVKSLTGMVRSVRDTWLLDYDERYSFLEVVRNPHLWLCYEPGELVQLAGPGRHVQRFYLVLASAGVSISIGGLIGLRLLLRSGT